jgi:hypothetical protein
MILPGVIVVYIYIERWMKLEEERMSTTYKIYKTIQISRTTQPNIGRRRGNKMAVMVGMRDTSIYLDE